MHTAPRLRHYVGLLILVLATTPALGRDAKPMNANWIWSPLQSHGNVPTGVCYFRHVFELDVQQPADIEIAADDTYEVFVNGRSACRGSGWKSLAKFDITPLLIKGKNAIAVKVVNRTGKTAGLAAKVNFAAHPTIVTDSDWKCSKIALPKWQQTRFADIAWKGAREIGVWGATAPWNANPVPSARRLAALNSPTKPIRVEVEVPVFEDDSRVVLAAHEEVADSAADVAESAEQATSKKKPLLLRPLKENFPWLKKRTARQANTNNQVEVPSAPKGPTGHVPGPRPSQPKEITNPHLATPSKAPASPKPEMPQAEVPQPSFSKPNLPKTELPQTNSLPNNAPSTRLPKTEALSPVEVEPSVGGLAPSRRDAMPMPPAELTATRFTPTSGFAVQQILPNEQTKSLISMAFNEFGQIIAGQENGPLLLMVDTNNDNKIDQARPYCELVKNCQGILALSGMVFVLADGPQGPGLYRLSDEDSDQKLEVATLLMQFEVSSAEHGPHGIVLGPDGNLYITIGNHTKLKDKYSPQSPRRNMYEGDLVQRYEDPGGHAMGIQLPAGAIVRTDINGHKFELFASGLRNAYDLAFNADGQLFTYDSDMEADSSTPWYRPTRMYHVLPGSEFGWRSGWAKWPEYYDDVVPPIASTGRGSPTGIVFYQHNTYPSEFRNAAFLADWSNGRIISATMKQTGAGYEVETATFIEGKPLNVTDIEVGPNGLLHFVTGGRGTNGGLYRVVWTGDKQETAESTGLTKALTAPQINSSWGRQTVAGVRQKMAKTWDREIEAAAMDASRPANERVQAMQLMQWVGPIPTTELLMEVSKDEEPTVRRMAAFLLTGSKEDSVPLRLLEMLSDSDATVRRQACESLVRSHRSVPYEYVAPLLSSKDRFEAYSARQLLQLDHPKEWLAAAMKSTDVRTFIQSSIALMTAWPSHDNALTVTKRAQEFMTGYLSDDDFISLLRVLQLAVLRGELSPEDVPELRATLAEEFPANGHDIMNRELIRLLVHLQETSIKDRYLAYLGTRGLEVGERVHAAMHIQLLEADWTTEEKLILFRHLKAPKGVGSGVPGYLQNAARDFSKKLLPEEDAKVIQNGSLHPSAALQAVLRLPEKLTVDQIRDLVALDRSVTATDADSKKLKVVLLAMLARDGSDPSMAYIREVYDNDAHRRVEATIALAEQPGGENWDYLVRSLPLLEGKIAKEIIETLRDVERMPNEPEPYRQVIMSGLRLGANGGSDAVRLLEHWRGFAPSKTTPPWNRALKAWQNWYETTYPGAPAAILEGQASASKWNYDKLLSHLNRTTEKAGSSERGKLVFQQAKCADCHQHGSLGEPMGPNLSTLSKRFLTKEILDSILYPSRVISDQYKAKILITDEGRSFTGIVGSGGPTELLVLQANGEKVRVKRDSIEQTVPSKVSAMPEGLIDGLTTQQVTDLMAFLKETPVEQLTSEPNQPVQQ